MSDYPDITLVIPFRNEAGFLKSTLETLVAQDPGPYTLEILLFDGKSTDTSLEIARQFERSSTSTVRFKVFINDKITAPGAFNTGIQLASAPIIGFGGAHTLYPPNYMRLAVELLHTIECDVVGGGHDQILASNPGLLSNAISSLYLSPMGAGVAAYHRSAAPAYVDTVYGGFYRRTVFERVGLFNEKLVRNQDNELNARVTSAGLRIYFHPGLSSRYVQKADLRSFMLRAWNFGQYHPVTWQVNPSSFRIRHFAPTLWVLYLLSLPVLGILGWLAWWAFLPLIAYFCLMTIATLQLMRIKPPTVSLLTYPLFIAYHILYGAGTLIGFAKLLFIKS